MLKLKSAAKCWVLVSSLLHDSKLKELLSCIKCSTNKVFFYDMLETSSFLVGIGRRCSSISECHDLQCSISKY